MGVYLHHFYLPLNEDEWLASSPGHFISRGNLLPVAIEWDTKMIWTLWKISIPYPYRDSNPCLRELGLSL
jgi:hypothetical protein